MCLKRNLKNGLHPLPRYRKQSGSALMVAVFILVVMSVIGAAMIRLLNDSTTGVITEVYGARAHQAAQSGVEVFLTELFPLNESSAASLCPERDNNINIKDIAPHNTYTFSPPGLANCSATLRCDELDVAPYMGRHFRILSSGQCNVGSQRFSRQLLVEARDES